MKEEIFQRNWQILEPFEGKSLRTLAVEAGMQTWFVSGVVIQNKDYYLDKPFKMRSAVSAVKNFLDDKKVFESYRNLSDKEFSFLSYSEKEGFLTSRLLSSHEDSEIEAYLMLVEAYTRMCKDFSGPLSLNAQRGKVSEIVSYLIAICKRLGIWRFLLRCSNSDVLDKYMEGFCDMLNVKALIAEGLYLEGTNLNQKVVKEIFVRIFK